MQLHFETYVAYHKINLLVIKCRNASFDISLENILGGGSVIIKVVMHKKKTVVRIIANSEFARFHCISKSA
jgi:hypothetical protein